MATQSQVNMLVQMCQERGLTATPVLADQAQGKLDNARVSHLFKVLKAKPVVKKSLGTSIQQGHGPVAAVKTAPKPVDVLDKITEGYYVLDGTFYKVMKNRDRTRLYARRLVATPNQKPIWEYDKGVIFKLSLSNKVTKEQAKAFGDIYHYCFCCGRELTVPLSIERGVGPVCWGKLGW